MLIRTLPELPENSFYTSPTTAPDTPSNTHAHLRINIDPILPAELSLDSIRELRTGTDQQGQRVSFFGFDPPPPKRRQNHACSSPEYILEDSNPYDGEYH